MVGAADHHSHILPGVDDGVETMDEALRILATYEELGIKELWLTPHIMEDIPNTPEKLKARFTQLQAAYNGNIVLRLAAEYMIDNHLRKLLQETPPRFRGEVVEDRRGEKSPKECPAGATKGEEDKTIEPQGEISLINNCPSCVRGASNAVAEGDKATEPQGEISLDSPSLPRGTTRGSVVCDDGYFSTPKECPIGATKGEGGRNPKQDSPHLLPIGNAGKHILVETSYFNPPMRLRETLRQIKSLGYYPLLAHPERYMYMDNDEYRSLREEGVKFQLNLVSLAGGYGAAVKKKAMWLLTNGLYSVAGSDLHSEDAIEHITKCRLGKQETEQVKSLLHNKI